LVEQWLEDVARRAIEQRDVHVQAAQAPRAEQATEPAADDQHSGTPVVRHCRSVRQGRLHAGRACHGQSRTRSGGVNHVATELSANGVIGGTSTRVSAMDRSRGGNVSTPDHVENTGDNLRHAAEVQAQARADETDGAMPPEQGETLDAPPDFNT
jgi:hypothetical protein